MHSRTSSHVIHAAMVFALALSSCRRPGQETPNGVYAAAPRNSIKSAVDSTLAALNRRDSVAYWNSLTFENREWKDARVAAQKLWDSAAGSRVSYDLLFTQEFTKNVHSYSEVARFGHALINLNFEGRKNLHRDSMLTILRADTGRWLVGGFNKLAGPGKVEDADY